MKTASIKTTIELKHKFDKFSEHIIKSTKINKTINHTIFSERLAKFADSFEKSEQKDVLTKEAEKLAQKLVSLKNYNIAGKIYSFLIKFNKGNIEALEKLATNALIIAKRLHDPIHIMARANDLKEIYKITKPVSEKYISVLYDEKRALNKIVKEYEKVNKFRVSKNRELRPVQGYEAKLAAVKLEIAENILKIGEKHNAKMELQEALAIYEKIGKGKNSEKIEILLKNL